MMNRRARVSRIPNAKQSAAEVFKRVFFIGVEPGDYKKIYEHKWTFPGLEEDLKEGGRIRGWLDEGKEVYIFGSAEPSTSQLQLVLVPSIVVLVCNRQIDPKIVCTSVQASEAFEYALSDFHCVA